MIDQLYYVLQQIKPLEICTGTQKNWGPNLKIPAQAPVIQNRWLHMISDYDPNMTANVSHQ